MQHIRLNEYIVASLFQSIRRYNTNDMLTTNDIQLLKYSSDLTATGIDYVLHALETAKHSEKVADFDCLRSWVAEKAVELAFRRHLVELEVPHNLVNTQNYGYGEQQGIQLGGRKCKLLNLHISQRKDIRLINRNLGSLISSDGLVSKSEIEKPGSSEDIFIFTVITGLVTRSLSELKKSISAEQPSFLICPFPQAWVRPSHWKGLGPIVVKGDCQDLQQISLIGEDRDHQKLRTHFELPIKERIEIEGDFYSLRQLQINALPSGPIGIHSPGLQYTLLIAPYQWGNLWVYGLKIYLLGFQSASEFFRLSRPISAGSSIFARPRIAEDYLAIPIEALRPIHELFSRAKKWAKR